MKHEGEGEESFEVESTLGIKIGLMGGFLLKNGLPGGKNGRDGIALENVGSEREKLVAEAIAGGDGLGIGRVLVEGKGVSGDVGIDLRAADGEEGAVDGEATAFGPGLHSAQAGGSAEEIEEDGLGLVVGVMGDDEVWGLIFPGAFTEEIVASLSSGQFDRVSG